MVLPPQPDRGFDLDELRGAAAAGRAVRVEVLVGRIVDDEEQFLDTLAALDDIIGEAPTAEVAILEPSVTSLDVAARGALLAEVVYRHGAPRPVPVVHQVVPPCNNHCAHCAVADLRARRPGGDVAAVDRALAELAASGEERVMFGISELSLLPDFHELLALARGHGFRAVYVSTNGRTFAEPGRAGRAVAAGATHFQVSLHGPDAVVHERLSGVPGSFAETCAGIRNLIAAGAQVLANVVVNRHNVARLEEVVDLLAGLGVRHVLLAQLPIQGRAAHRVDELLVPLAEAAPRMLATAQRAEAAGVAVGLAGVPYCLAPGAERFLGVDDLTSVYDADPAEALLMRVPFVRSRPCVRCAAYAICRGASEEYLRRRGSDELRPLPGPRATTRPVAPLASFYDPPPAEAEAAEATQP